MQAIVDKPKAAVATLPRVPLLVLLFVLVPIAEIYVIIQVGQAIGALPTIAILIADSLLGAYLLRSQGWRAWLAFREALAAGRMPHREILDGVLVIVGGAFLLTPGFLTDVAGLLLLLPPTRRMIGRGLTSLLLRRGALRWRTVVMRPPGRRPPPRPYAEPAEPPDRPGHPPPRLPPPDPEPPQG
jgi:UPF0716 protein FxsA